VNFIETAIQDFRCGARMLGRNPVVAGIAILTLAMGIDARSAGE